MRGLECTCYLAMLLLTCLLFKHVLFSGEIITNGEYLKAFKGLHRTDYRALLKPLLIERSVGTEGHTMARNYIIDQLKSSGWVVDLDIYTQNTVIGKRSFTNIRAKLPNPLNKVTNDIYLACHYESKQMPFEFIGATDSAVPCSMILSIASKLNSSFMNHVQLQASKGIGIQLVFFDGEEAFISWTHEDSLYGSRHLAAKMSSNMIGNGRREIDTIKLLILLDLIGSSDTVFANMYPQQSDQHYKSMQNIENLLCSKEKWSCPSRRMFSNSYCNLIMDDHIPFQQQGVPVLHLISCPFPRVWHSKDDNENALDYQYIQHFLDILTIHLARTFELKV
ncbi:hypothetical protein GJ496_009145 [Pomphorhynchus laevis]|nr:hypothetical protein GJ496_009145 [Pomphorhynchus laevis]